MKQELKNVHQFKSDSEYKKFYEKVAKIYYFLCILTQSLKWMVALTVKKKAEDEVVPSSSSVKFTFLKFS